MDANTGEPAEADRQSGGPEDLPQAGAHREVTASNSLVAGTVKVSGLVDKRGKNYHGYITWQPGQKYPAFMFPKDYKTALEEGRVKPAVENEVQVAVNSRG